jgi:hypothetical protein
MTTYILMKLSLSLKREGEGGGKVGGRGGILRGDIDWNGEWGRVGGP